MEIKKTLASLSTLWGSLENKFPALSKLKKESKEPQPDDLVDLKLRIPYKALKHIETLGNRTKGGTPEVMRQATVLYDISREMLEEGAEIYFKTFEGFEPLNPGFVSSWRAKFVIIQGGKK